MGAIRSIILANNRDNCVIRGSIFSMAGSSLAEYNDISIDSCYPSVTGSELHKPGDKEQVRAFIALITSRDDLRCACLQ